MVSSKTRLINVIKVVIYVIIQLVIHNVFEGFSEEWKFRDWNNHSCF